MKSGEADVQSLTNNAALTTVARARLSHLVNEGVVFGIGISRKDNKDVVFVAVNAQASDPNSPDLESIHRRLKDALQDIPFEILGGYDNVFRSDNPPSLTEMPKAALLKVVPQYESLSNAVDEVTLGTTRACLQSATARA
jgi:hypothetical protein